MRTATLIQSATRCWLAPVMLALTSLCGGWASADTFPSKAIKIVVPFTAGSATDTAARVIASALAPRLNVPVVVENKPGAAGTLGSNSVATAPADGYTLVLTSSSTHSAASALIEKVPYDASKDFIHITRIATIPIMLVTRANLPATTVPVLVASSIKDPLSYAYGSAASQIAAGTFVQLTGTLALGIPYKSQPPAVTDLIGGQVDFMFADVSVVKPFLTAGRLKGLAVSAPARTSDFPSIPTLKELGLKGFDLVVWVGLAAPKGTPSRIVEKLSQEAVAALKSPEVVAKLSASGMDVSPNTLSEHTAFVQSQSTIWTARAQVAGIKPE